MNYQWLLQWLVILFAGSLFFPAISTDVLGGLLVLLLLWMGYRWKEQLSQRRLLISAGPLNYLFPIWIAIVVVGFAFRDFEPSDWYFQLLFFKWIFLFYFLLTAVRYLQPDEKVILPTSIFLCLLSACTIAIWFLGFEPLTSSELTKGPMGLPAAGSVFIGPEVFSLLLSCLVCLTSGLFIAHMKWNERGRWILFFSTVLMASALFLTMQVDVWLSTLLAVVLIAMLMSFRFAMFYLLVKVSGIIGVAYFWEEFRQAFYVRWTQIAESATTSFQQNFESVQNHFFLGVGFGHQSHYLGQYDALLVTTGLAGFIIFVVIQFAFLSLSFRVWQRVNSKDVFHQGLTLGLIGAQFSLLFLGLLHQQLEQPNMVTLMILLWAMVIYLAYEYRVLRERI